MSEYTLGLSLLSPWCDAGASSVVGFESLAFKLLVDFRNGFRIKVAIIAHIGRYQDTFIIL